MREQIAPLECHRGDTPEVGDLVLVDASGDRENSVQHVKRVEWIRIEEWQPDKGKGCCKSMINNLQYLQRVTKRRNSNCDKCVQLPAASLPETIGKHKAEYWQRMVEFHLLVVQSHDERDACKQHSIAHNSKHSGCVQTK